jgi:hypothetical protein
MLCLLARVRRVQRSKNRNFQEYAEPRLYLSAFDLPSLLSAPTVSNDMINRYNELDVRHSTTINLTHDTFDHQRTYLNCSHGMPIVFDTGASASCSPLREAFIGDLDKPEFDSLQGLKGKIKVVGTGIVEWTIFDMNGVTRTIRTKALYVPGGNIRLLSPQTYFQEHMKGLAKVGATDLSWTLADGTILRFPYAGRSNLPIMLTKEHSSQSIGLTYHDVKSLTDPFIVSSYVNVADETNQNLTASQKELLLWHWRFGHINLQWVQMLAATPQNPDELSIVLSKQPTVSSCSLPLCLACQLAKQSRRIPEVTRFIADPTKQMLTKREHLVPGQMVSLDQYMGSTPGRLPNTKGKELKKDKYTGGTIFVDHASGFVFVRNQVSLRAGETVIAKKAFESLANSFGVKVKGYHADNVPFDSVEFKADLLAKNQTLDLSGVGAHHQNSVAERAIKTITSLARSMMLHMSFHWPAQADLQLWPFAFQHAVFLWNHIPNRMTRIAPVEIFSGTRHPTSEVLHRCRVWGCPVYVLSPELQDGKKIPKWHPRSRRGMFLGYSPVHSSTVGQVLNLVTGNVSSQYHLVYDELFTTVSSTALRDEALPDRVFRPDVWNDLIISGHERHDCLRDVIQEQEVIPLLGTDWLTPSEIDARQSLRESRQIRRRQVEQEVTPGHSPTDIPFPSTPTTRTTPQPEFRSPLATRPLPSPIQLQDPEPSTPGQLVPDNPRAPTPVGPPTTPSRVCQ